MENKTTKYLKYAIGEIVLVVVGILIALQINNWNEQRKYHNLELSMLTEIQSSLEESLVEINGMLTRNEKTVQDYMVLLNHVKNHLAYDESLDKYFGDLTFWPSPFFNYSAYETLKTLGAGIISNDSLRKSIIRMYDREFEFMVNDYDKAEWNYSSAVVYPFFSKHFERHVNSRDAFPNDYEELINNPEFKNILTNLIVLRSNGISRSEDLKLSLETLINDISKEIEGLN